MSDRWQNDVRRYLQDVVFWVERAEHYVEGLSEQDFAADFKACDAVCWCITCAGEAAGAVLRRQPELRREADLAHAYAMRNRITHGYFAVDVGIVLAVANIYPPRLRQVVLRLLEADA